MAKSSSDNPDFSNKPGVLIQQKTAAENTVGIHWRSCWLIELLKVLTREQLSYDTNEKLGLNSLTIENIKMKMKENSELQFAKWMTFTVIVHCVL